MRQTDNHHIPQSYFQLLITLLYLDGVNKPWAFIAFNANPFPHSLHLESIFSIFDMALEGHLLTRHMTTNKV